MRISPLSVLLVFPLSGVLWFCIVWKGCGRNGNKDDIFNMPANFPAAISYHVKKALAYCSVRKSIDVYVGSADFLFL